MRYIVDSCYYIDLLRAGIDVRIELIDLALSNSLVSCGVINAEVLRGCRTTLLRDELSAFFSLLPMVELNANEWQDIALLAWELDRRGKILPLTDISIAVAAQKADATIISRDLHFQQIPDLKVKSTL